MSVTSGSRPGAGLGLRRVLGMSAAVLAATPAFAQVEEIVVTARRREENLQEVPIAVSVLSDERIEREGVRELADVAQLTPGVTFDTGFWPSDTRLSIRGLFARAGRPSAAVLIDGIDASGEALESAGGSALLNQRLFDIERVEVVKGPQSALYGRSAFAGAISYTTRRPVLDAWEGSAVLDLGDYGRRELRAAVSGPVSEDRFGLRLVGSSFSSDGYYQNTANGEPLGGGDSEGAGLGLLWQVTEDFSAYWLSSFSSQKYDLPPVAVVRANEFQTLVVPDFSTPAPDDTRLVGLEQFRGTIKAGPADVNISPNRTNGGNFQGTDDEVFRTHLILEWDLGGARFESRTAWVDADTRLRSDTTQQASGPGEELDDNTFQTYNLAGTGITVNYAGFNSAADYEWEFKQLFQEFILRSEAEDSRWSWLAGLNWFDEEASDLSNTRIWYRDPDNTLCNLGAPCLFEETTPFGKTIFRDTTSYSAFGLVSFDLLENLTLTAEARVIYDEVEVSATSDRALAYSLSLPSSIPPEGPPPAGTVDDTNVVPRFTATWRATETFNVYASVANGIKPPTFNTTDFIDPEISQVEKEDLWSYELGAKTTWLGGTLLLNTAAFYNDYSDQQVFIQFPAVAGTFPAIPRNGSTNAAEVTVWGAELELLWQPTDSLTASLGYAYTNGEYDDFVLAELVDDPSLVGVSNQIKSGTVDGDFSGNDTLGNPEHSFTWLLQYRKPATGDMDWFVQSTGQYQGERYADISNLVTLEDYTVVNFQAGLEGETWSLTAYLDNALDDDTIRYAQEFIDQRKGFTQSADVDPGPAVQPVSLGYPVAYYANLPDPRVFGVRFLLRTR